MTMDFSDKYIRESDFEFFNSLPEDERLLLLYDLFFDEELLPCKEVIEEHKSSQTKDLAYVQTLDKILLINSTSEEAIETLIKQFYYDGIVLSKVHICTPALSEKFKFLKYFSIYKVVGNSTELHDN